jgi:hypothetical protein
VSAVREAFVVAEAKIVRAALLYLADRAEFADDEEVRQACRQALAALDRLEELAT